MKSCITVSLVKEAAGGPFVYWYDLEAACREAAELGFDAIELFPPAHDAVDRAELKRLLNAHHLRLAAVGTGAGWVKHRLHLTHPQTDVRARAIAFIRDILSLAGEFGAAAIIGSMQGRTSDDVTHDQALGWLVEALAGLGETARELGTILLYEPLNRYETNLVNTVAAGCTLLSRVHSDNVKLLADLFHMNIEEADLAQALVAGGDHIGHIHFVDSNRRAAGMGHLDFAPVIAALRKIDYTGYLCAEAFPLPDATAAARQTIQSFRQLVRQGDQS